MFIYREMHAHEHNVPTCVKYLIRELFPMYGEISTWNKQVGQIGHKH